MEQIQRLLDAVVGLSPRQLNALIEVAEQMQPAPEGVLSDEQFAAVLASAPVEEMDEETARLIESSMAEAGEDLTLDEVRQRLRS